MTRHGSSVLIDYLDGEEAAVDDVTDHAGERAVAAPLVVVECSRATCIGRVAPP